MFNVNIPKDAAHSGLLRYIYSRLINKNKEDIKGENQLNFTVNNLTEKRKPIPRITDKIVNTGFQSSLE
jgi:hypothetical protein